MAPGAWTRWSPGDVAKGSVLMIFIIQSHPWILPHKRKCFSLAPDCFKCLKCCWLLACHFLGDNSKHELITVPLTLPNPSDTEDGSSPCISYTSYLSHPVPVAAAQSYHGPNEYHWLMAWIYGTNWSNGTQCFHKQRIDSCIQIELGTPQSTSFLGSHRGSFIDLFPLTKVCFTWEIPRTVNKIIFFPGGATCHLALCPSCGSPELVFLCSENSDLYCRDRG